MVITMRWRCINCNFYIHIAANKKQFAPEFQFQLQAYIRFNISGICGLPNRSLISSCTSRNSFQSDFVFENGSQILKCNKSKTYFVHFANGNRYLRCSKTTLAGGGNGSVASAQRALYKSHSIRQGVSVLAQYKAFAGINAYILCRVVYREQIYVFAFTVLHGDANIMELYLNSAIGCYPKTI